MALTKISNNSLSAISSLPASIPTGALTLISTTTISSGTSSVEFTSGLDSTYDSYIFKLINIHPSSASSYDFGFQGSTDGGTTYGVTATTTFFDAYQYETVDSKALRYLTSRDLAQSTSLQPLAVNISVADADQAASGYLQLFNPSSTTFVKHFISKMNTAADGGANDFTDNSYIGGYFNTTSAINAIEFKVAGDNIDDGIIKLYGVS